MRQRRRRKKRKGRKKASTHTLTLEIAPTHWPLHKKGSVTYRVSGQCEGETCTNRFYRRVKHGRRTRGVLRNENENEKKRVRVSGVRQERDKDGERVMQ